MLPRHFDSLAAMLKERSGLFLTPDKTYLLEARLGPVAARWKLSSVEELADQLDKRPPQGLIDATIEAMTTNESSFFRDKTPFDYFSNVMLPALLKVRSTQRRLTIWSAASSSGQEAYSLAILVKEQGANLAGWKIDILGTDLSNEMVERSRQGLYNQFEAQRGLPARFLMKYFKKDGDKWRINEDLRNMVHFKKVNLLEPASTAALPIFDIIFCRNVLIYFDRSAKSDVLSMIDKHLANDGFLILGGSETTIGLSSTFIASAEHRGLYKKT